MKKFNTINFLIFLFVEIVTFIFIPSIIPSVFASHKTFQDNFDNATESNSKWQVSGPQLFNGDGTQANWKFENNMYGINILNRGFQSNETIPSNWDMTIKDYSFEVDMKIVNGVDTNLVFRYKDHDHWYGIHGINNENRLVLQKAGSPWASPPPEKTYHFTPDVFYQFKVDVQKDNIKVYINNEQMWDVTDTGTLLSEGPPGLQAGTGAVTSVEVWFDNVVVTDIDNYLPVPYFSQNALPWGPTEYDSASSLGIPDPTMDRWGCTITSAAMVLNFHGMAEFTDGTVINPETLNDWLKNNGGYSIGKDKNGEWYSYLSFPVIGTLTQQLHAAGKSTVKLEHQRPVDNLTNTLDNDLLVEQIPAIIHVPGHFVVAKGKTNGIYDINDPEWNYPTLASFNNSFDQLDRYVPSNTDLTYIVAVVNPDVELLITDSQGRRTGKLLQNGQMQEFNEIPGATYSFQPPISNPNSDGILESLGTGVNELLIPKPLDGNYTITTSSQGDAFYTLNVSTFKTEGDFVNNKVIGTLTTDNQDSLLIDYSKVADSPINRIVTFQTTIDDINEAKALGFISKDSIAKRLVNMIENASNQTERGNLQQATNKLNQFEDLLNKERGDTIIEDVYQILLEDIAQLKQNLQ